MSDLAIRAAGLGKRYFIGAARPRYATLRDRLASGIARPVRRAASLLRGHASGAADLAEEIWAVRDVGLSVQPGEIVGLVGRNGAGKSTLLKILARITEPTCGRAEIRGRVGSLLEVGTGFHPELTGRENIYLNGAILGMRRVEIAAKFDEIVAFAEVERFIDTPVKHYSSGMHVRLAFAVAAHLEPEILLVDEVLAVGDAAFQRKCLDKMDSVAGGGRTILFVSHNMTAVQRLCSRAILLEDGSVAMEGDVARVVLHYLGAAIGSERPGEWVDLAGATRRGTGEVHFIAARYSSREAAHGNLPFTGGPLSFDLLVRADRARSLPSLAVTLLDQAGNKLVNADTLRVGHTIELAEGNTSVAVTIDALHLNPGTYAVRLWASGLGGDPYDLVETAFHIEVVARQGRELGRTPTRDGLVPCDFAVETSASDHADASRHTAACPS